MQLGLLPGEDKMPDVIPRHELGEGAQIGLHLLDRPAEHSHLMDARPKRARFQFQPPHPIRLRRNPCQNGADAVGDDNTDQRAEQQAEQGDELILRRVALHSRHHLRLWHQRAKYPVRRCLPLQM
jgi:hypothetical protein